MGLGKMFFYPIVDYGFISADNKCGFLYKQEKANSFECLDCGFRQSAFPIADDDH